MTEEELFDNFEFKTFTISDRQFIDLKVDGGTAKPVGHSSDGLDVVRVMNPIVGDYVIFTSGTVCFPLQEVIADLRDVLGSAGYTVKTTESQMCMSASLSDLLTWGSASC